MPSPPGPSRRRVTLVGAVSLALVALALAWGLWRASVLAWLSDDGFISFRYAEHLVAGHGLVYNVGERVEGYTNLLWTLLLAAAMALGVPPEVSSQALGIAVWLALVLVLVVRSWRRSGGARPFLPLAAALVLLMEDYQTWATGGLETSLFTLLVVGGLLLATRADARTRDLVLAAMLLALAVATRPDGVIFAAIAVAGTGWAQPGAVPRQRLTLLGAIVIPLAVAGAALVAWKLAYYDDLFPTAFYSKSALDPYHGQGWYYIGLFLLKNWFIIPLTLLLLAGALRARGAAALLVRRHVLLLLAAGLFLLYVAHSGGDFMFARRVLPAMPLLFLVLEDWLVTLPGRLLPTAALVLAAAGLLLPYPVFTPPGERRHGIADEPSFYPPALMEARRVQALVAAEAFKGMPVRAAFEGGMCVFGYYSRLPYLVEMTGLTQYSLAKAPLMARGHVGHEKVASDEWLADHDIHFVFSQVPPPISRGGPLRIDEIAFGEALRARIVIYDEAMMDRLRKDPRVAFTPIEVTLREAQHLIAIASPEEARRIYAALERYYFRRAGPSKQAQADALRRQVEARRAPGTR